MRAGVGFVVGFVVLALGAGPAAARPPSLTGEVFSQHTSYTGPTSGVCTAGSGGSTSYSMDFAGFARGPYPGSFSERIRATVGPRTAPIPIGPFPDGFVSGPGPDSRVPAGQLLSLTADFTINSSAGAVTGTKTLTAVVPADSRHAGACVDSYRDVRAFGAIFKATITTAEGKFLDEGSTDLQARQGKASNQGGLLFDVNDLGESFDSGGSPPTSAQPPVARCDAYWVRPGVALKVPARGFLGNDSDPKGLALRGVVDYTNFAAADHPYSFNGATGALGLSPVAKPFKTVIDYHVVNSAGLASKRARITIYVQRKPPSPSVLKGCPGIYALSFSPPVVKPGVTTLRVQVRSAGGIGVAQAKVTKKKPALIKAVRTKVSTAGTVALKLRPTAAGRRVLAHRHSIKVKTKLTYTPKGAKPRTTLKTATIK